MDANVSLGELQQKIKRLEGLCQVSKIGYLDAVRVCNMNHRVVVFLCTSKALGVVSWLTRVKTFIAHYFIHRN